MTVKDLVGFYDPKPTYAQSSSSRTSRVGPPPSPARFLHHAASRKETTQTVLSSPPNPSEIVTKHHEETKHYEVTNDTKHSTNTSLRSLTLDSTLFPQAPLLETTSIPLQPLTSMPTAKRSNKSNHSSSSSDSEVSKETLVTSSQKQLASKESKSLRSTHTPIPAVTVFAPKAPPLYLPSLDKHLESLPMPAFDNYPTNPSQKISVFPPMDRLTAVGKSIKDLETNSTIAPAWRNRSSVFGGLLSLVIGVAGSSAIATFYSLQGVFDTVQVFALILSTIVPHSGHNVESKWKQLFLGTIPKVVALNFASTLVQSLLFLLILMAVAGVLVYYFYHSTCRCQATMRHEGLQSTGNINRGWGLLIVTFLLTVIYLPLSTIAMHVLVWSEDLWVVPNPYVNSTSSPPIVAPLGPPDEFRDTLDFCYTTTMKRNEVNFAPFLVIVSAVTFLFMTIWFPIHLGKVIDRAVPIVDKYTELGTRRSKSDMDREYQRLLARDTHPLTFLYSDFRRGWGAYKSYYLFAKFTALFVVATIDPDNCLFRSLTRDYVAIVRQSLLLAIMLGFFLVQCFLAPFVDPVNNASEWTSRLNYVLTSFVGLGVAVNMPGKALLNGPILYVIYVATYGLTIYFAIINLSWMHKTVKRITRRIDFSIDIFSPRLDTSSHVLRRIWQESITTLLLTTPDCKIPSGQHMAFSQDRECIFPPYLLDFKGSPAERHVENLKILREVGSAAYLRGLTDPFLERTGLYGGIVEKIQTHFTGPDSFWKDPDGSYPFNSSKGFGNAWWIPFPPTLVLQYDDGPRVTLSAHNLELYVKQNNSEHVRRRREIRMALRTLDGKVVRWPYEHQSEERRANLFCCCERQYRARTLIKYSSCVFRIKRQGELVWQKTQLGSGFGVELTYSKFVHVDESAIGLNDDYELTPALARFLSMNNDLIDANLPHLEAVFQSYRDSKARECRNKLNVLSYRFLTQVYDKPEEASKLAQTILSTETDLRVRQLVTGNEIALEATYNRFAWVASSEAAMWWYIFWDDFWRRNFDTVKPLQTHSQDFDPHSPTSIAYRPLPRAALETFLVQRGLLSTPPNYGDFINSGLLNKIYLRLNEIVFHGSSKTILFHAGDGDTELDLEGIDVITHANSSTLGTGGGTDHDDSSIRARPVYKWEGILEDPRSKRVHRQGWRAKLGTWFGLSPFWRAGVTSKGISLDVKLVKGRYVALSGADPG